MSKCSSHLLHNDPSSTAEEYEEDDEEQNNKFVKKGIAGDIFILGGVRIPPSALYGGLLSLPEARAKSTMNI